MALAALGVIGVGVGAFIYLVLFLLDKRNGCCVRLIAPLFIICGTAAAATGLIYWAVQAASFIDSSIVEYHYHIGFILDVIGAGLGVFCIVVAFI
jgi:hypothetical protein